MDHEARGRIADDVLELGNGETGVQRQEHRAEPAAGELHLQRIRGVHGKHGDPVAARNSKPVAQVGGEARNARVELRVSKLASAGEVDNRRFVWRAAAEMGDPVVISNRQTLLPGFRGLAPPACDDPTPFPPLERCCRVPVSRSVAGVQVTSPRLRKRESAIHGSVFKQPVP